METLRILRLTKEDYQQQQQPTTSKFDGPVDLKHREADDEKTHHKVKQQDPGADVTRGITTFKPSLMMMMMMMMISICQSHFPGFYLKPVFMFECEGTDCDSHTLQIQTKSS